MVKIGFPCYEGALQPFKSQIQKKWVSQGFPVKSLNKINTWFSSISELFIVQGSVCDAEVKKDFLFLGPLFSAVTNFTEAAADFHRRLKEVDVNK